MNCEVNQEDGVVLGWSLVGGGNGKAVVATLCANNIADCGNCGVCSKGVL